MYILILSFAITIKSFGQTDSLENQEKNRVMAELTTLGIASGLHISKFPMLEIGYFKHTIFEFPMTWGSSYTIESYFSDDFVIAPKINYWINILFVNIGFSVPWYFNFYGYNSLKIRPEIGLGYKNFKINYSTNISLTNKDMKSIGSHFISLNYYIGLK